MNILICEDHDITIEGIDSILKKSGIDYTLHSVNNGKDATRYLSKHDCQLVILDISLKHKEGNHNVDEDGLVLLKDIKAGWPVVKVLMMSMHDENYMIHASFDNGAQGYLFKMNASCELIIAIETVMKGMRYLSPGLQKKYEIFCAHYKDTLYHKLSKAEKMVANRWVTGESTKDTAVILGRSESTIRNQKASILKTTQTNSASEFMKYYKFLKEI